MVTWVSSLLAAMSPMQAAHAAVLATTQAPERILDEARTVYLGNLARRENGKAPLKWNKQLTQASRWFSWDSTENRPEKFCEHQDSQGNSFDVRLRLAGYKGAAHAENAYCGMLSPSEAITGWLASPGHHDNLLADGHQEVGLGYYFNGTRGFVTQDFGTDSDYTPLIINNEAITTTTSQVELYLHNRTSNSVYGFGPTTQFRVSNSPDFGATPWVDYTNTKAWTLAAGTGWRTVYVQTRDAMLRMAIVTDTIYVGENVPLSELGDAMMSSNQGSVVLSNIGSDSTGLDLIQFVPGWAMDNTENPQAFGGSVGTQPDENAWGKSTFCLNDSQSSGRIWTSDFVQDVPMQAYFRVRASDNTAAIEIARLRVTAGANTSEPVVLNGNQFTQANEYQEFRVPFTFHKGTDASQAFLMFEFWRSGSAAICLDAVSIFPDPTQVTSQMTVTIPNGNYRGQILWGRYANKAGQFSKITDFNPMAPAGTPTPAPTFTVKAKVYLALLGR